MEPFQRATAWIDLGAVERNCERLRAELGAGTELCAVVKANGYGHGMVECARAALAGGATTLAVATAGEAFELRAALSEEPILVMGALTDAELDVALGARAELGVWREGFVEAVAERGSRFDLRPRIHLKYDTGMGRLGARAELGVWREAFVEAVAERGSRFDLRPRIHLKYDTGMGRLGEREPANVERMLARAAEDERLELAGLWTHFATADDRDSDFFDRQLERFRTVAEPARERYGVKLHAANSAATLRDAAAHFDLVRCGVAIYGLDPFGSDPDYVDLTPVMSLSSYVADVKRVEPGDSAGYGRRWRAERETFIGVVPFGYGDGYRRGLSDAFDVLIAGRRYPVVGTVSMDNITVELGPDPTVIPGEEVVLLGRSGEGRITAEEWARRLETINYEITCGISPRVPRLQRR